MNNLAPHIFRQRVLMEGIYTIEVDRGALARYMSGLAARLELSAYGEPVIYSPAGLGKEENQGFDAFLPLIDSGLAAYVWTHDIGRALRAAHAIEAGWVQVNQGLGQSPGHSYGGIKQSGIGREFSLEGMLDSFTQKKNVTVNLNTPSR